MRGDRDGEAWRNRYECSRGDGWEDENWREINVKMGETQRVCGDAQRREIYSMRGFVKDGKIDAVGKIVGTGLTFLCACVYKDANLLQVMAEKTCIYQLVC